MAESAVVTSLLIVAVVLLALLAWFTRRIARELGDLSRYLDDLQPRGASEKSGSTGPPHNQ